MSPEQAIAQLRTLQPAQRVTASAAQIRTIIEDINDARPLDVTAGRGELADLGADGILEVVAQFGMYRARVKKRNAPKAEALAWYDSGMLFPPSRTEVLAQRQRQIRRAKRRNEEIDWDHIPPVILPHGYEKGSGHRRDLGKSIAAIVVTGVEDEEIIRFVARHYEEASALLSADHVHLLWWTLSHGLADKLTQLQSNHATLAGLLVQAYDLLDVARIDAITALADVLSASSDDIVGLRDALSRCRWLSPGEIGRLERVVVEFERGRDNASLRKILTSRLGNFASWVRNNPDTFALTDVSQMSEAQLRAVLTLTGLSTDEAAEKEIVGELRANLTRMGLGADLDREIAEGLRAAKFGRLEEFYASRQARVDGDPDWAVAYAESLADASDLTRATRTAVAV